MTVLLDVTNKTKQNFLLSPLLPLYLYSWHPPCTRGSSLFNVLIALSVLKIKVRYSVCEKVDNIASAVITVSHRALQFKRDMCGPEKQSSQVVTEPSSTS